MSLRNDLVKIGLDWEMTFGVMPSITSTVSEFDAAIDLVELTTSDYSCAMAGASAVRKGYDFEYDGIKYQIKANRPSGKPGSPVMNVPKANPDKMTENYLWDKLIWILYDKNYVMQEAWEFDTAVYGTIIAPLSRVTPDDMRKGKKLFPLI